MERFLLVLKRRVMYDKGKLIKIREYDNMVCAP
jgi:hypothetical protein